MQACDTCSEGPDSFTVIMFVWVRSLFTCTPTHTHRGTQTYRCTRTQTHTYAYIRTFIHTHIRTYIHTCTRIHTHTYTHSLTCTHGQTHSYIHINTDPNQIHEAAMERGEHTTQTYTIHIHTFPVHERRGKEEFSPLQFSPQSVVSQQRHRSCFGMDLHGKKISLFFDTARKKHSCLLLRW